MIIGLLELLNGIVWFIVFIVVILDFLKVDYSYKNQLNRELSKIQVPFNETYKILLLFLIPIVISFLLGILKNIIY